jgi:protein-S-isoprenylcysteine O-methyltransferase Ste14
VTPVPPSTDDALVTTGRFGRAVAVVYGVAAYAGFLAVTLYAIAFLADVGVSRTIDRGPHRSATAPAVAIDTALLGLFAVQHSVMARHWFKRRWMRLVTPPLERSTYVLTASAALAVIFWQWRPIDDVVWAIDGAGAGALWVCYGLGWLVVVCSTFLIDHFALFGLRQIYSHARGVPHHAPGFTAPLLYRFVRHPMMVGFLIVFWAAPTMTVGHLLFSTLASAYIVVAVRLEERDLSRELPGYRAYQATTPRFIPRGRSPPRHRSPGPLGEKGASPPAERSM